MAAQRQKKQAVVKGGEAARARCKKAITGSDASQLTSRKEELALLAEDHLVPLPLVFTVLLCSGALWVLAFRDVFATGRSIAGDMDEAMLFFTKSKQFFNNANGWKSTQGGISSIQNFTSDANNMGGLFVRKFGGAAALAVHTQKLFPLLFHPLGAQWKMGHFKPLLKTAMIGNIAIAALYGLYLEDLTAAGADGFAKVVIALLAFETLAMVWYVAKQPSVGKFFAVAMPEGKTPSSVASRIVMKTVVLVSGVLTLIFGRDLFLPGQIMDFIPRDDIYLEWTGALIHSPPEGSEEAINHSMESPLYVGDKFVSQLMALHMLILCAYKFVTAFAIRYGSDGSGEVKCKMIWKGQAIGDALLVFILRLFTPAAMSASLDLRWHLMSLAYETFILGLHAFM